MHTRPVILLFGMPRSGTTWIGKIFDSHPRTLYRHEPDTWNKITRIPLLEPVANADQHCEFVRGYVDDIVNSARLEISAKRPFFPKGYSSALRQQMFRTSVLLADAALRLNGRLRLPIVRPCDPARASEFTVVWKSIQLLGRMGVMVNCLDNVKCIHIVRHPCGYVSSVLDGESKKKFTSHTPASDDWPLFELLLETTQAQRYGLSMKGLKALAPEERLAWRWVLFNEKAMDDNANDQNVKILKYEDMCENPIDTAQVYFEFCGLGWPAQTEQFLAASTAKNSDSYYSVYKDPVSSANKWRNKLTTEQVNRIRNVIDESIAGKFYKDSFQAG